MDSTPVWMALEHGFLLDTPQSLPLTVPFLPLHGESCMHSHHPNTFKTVTMTWVNGDTTSSKIFRCCTARTPCVCKDLPFATGFRQKVPKWSRSR